MSIIITNSLLADVFMFNKKKQKMIKKNDHQMAWFYFVYILLLIIFEYWTITYDNDNWITYITEKWVAVSI